jgi:hypothetical protein
VGYCIVCCLIVICFVSFPLCYVLITIFMFFIIRFAFFVFVLCFTFYFVYSVLLYCFVYCFFSCLLYSCFFLFYLQVYWPLPPGENLIVVNKYHIISYPKVRLRKSHFVSLDSKRKCLKTGPRNVVFAGMIL